MQCSEGRLALCVLGVTALCTVVGSTKEGKHIGQAPKAFVDDGWPRPDPRPPYSDYLRLPDTLIPTHYNIELRPQFYDPDPDDFILEGNVTITLNVEKSTDVITVHYRTLVINEEDIRVSYEGGNDVGVVETEIEEELEFYHIKLDEDLQEGTVITVFIAYTAPLTNDRIGIYYSRYYQHGELQYMLGTQFEPLDARKAYPCLDEPALKAYFNVTMWRKEPMMALTNMQNYSSDIRGEWIVDHFEVTSVPMPTYLLAFAWADFDYLDNTTSTGLSEKYLRDWAAPEAKATGQLDYSNEIAGAIFDELEIVFDIPFDLKKLDQIALREYKYGAMENWGLVTYDDTRLLIHPNFTSYYDQQRLTNTMSHELVHMWFGNQVTCKWWDDLWLQETFATFFEVPGMSNGRTPITVDWEHIYLVQSFFSGYRSDDAGQANAIHFYPTTTAEIEESSSVIYNKGAAVVRMMKNFVFDDEPSFMDAQKQYLNDNMHSNANYEDLISAWEPHVSPDLPVTFSTMLESWILQSGHPVITVNRDEADPTTFMLTQSMFLVDDQRPIHEQYPPPFNYSWVVPFAYVTADDPDTDDMQAEWMNLEDGEITVPGLTADEWILGNPGMYGFYRVNYDPENWQLLQEQLESDHTVIDVRNRALLLYDSVLMSQAGIVSADLPINMIQYLSSEVDYMPWFAAEESISRLDTMLTLTDYYGEFRDHVRDSILPVYNDLGWVDEGDDEDFERKYLRTLALELSCKYMNEECIGQASVLFDQWVNQGERSRSVIDPAQRKLIGCTHLANRESLSDWDNLFAVYQEVRNYHKLERARIRDALACTKDQWTLIRYANLAFSRAPEIDEDDYSSVLSQVAINPAGRDIVWSMLEEQWEEVPERTSVLGTITNYFTTTYQLQKLESFFELHPPSTPSETAAYEANRYKVEANIRWRDRILDANPTF